MLVSCQPMAQSKPAFAELLLPPTFADLAVQPNSGSLALQLGGHISQHVLPRLHCHPKVARLLLACLNHLHSLYVDAKMASGGGGGGGSKGKGKAGASGAGALAAEVELWRRVYWVEVDYLGLAAAAARCGAHFTALLYIEAWQEARHGWLAPLALGGAGQPLLDGSGEAEGEEAGAGATAVVERLLLDTYSAISEPDSIYAVARSHGMLSQVRRTVGCGVLLVQACHRRDRPCACKPDCTLPPPPPTCFLCFRPLPLPLCSSSASSMRATGHGRCSATISSCSTWRAAQSSSSRGSSRGSSKGSSRGSRASPHRSWQWAASQAQAQGRNRPMRPAACRRRPTPFRASRSRRLWRG